MKPIFLILIILIFAVATKAQTCTGSVGDPIVNLTFGTGQAINGPPLPDGTTNLTYWEYDCPNDGQYSITNLSGSCFINTWHSLTDHTGDLNGYFMLINASEKPNDFFVQTIDGLCAGTQYQFGAWVANMCNFTSSVKPNITFTIEKTDGTVLGRYNTGDISVNLTTAEWKQYAFNFTTPVGASTVVLRMRNNAPGGSNNPGNDLGLDDITFRPIGPKVSVFAPDITGDTTLACSQDTKAIGLHSTIEQCYPTTAYQWQLSTDNGGSWSDVPGATGTVYNRASTPSGVYLYRLTAAQQGNISVSTCRVTSSPFGVNVYDPDSRTINITSSKEPACEGSPVTFSAHTTYAGKTPSFQWLLNDKAVGTSDSSLIINATTTGDKVSCIFTSSLSCNSPATSNSIGLSVLKKARTSITKSICDGDSYEGYNKSGTYDNIYPGSNGCDSIRTLTLTVHPKQHTTLDTSICYGTSYLGLNQPGSYDYTYTDVYGCDSVHTISLHVLPDIYARPLTDTILCSGDSLNISPTGFDTYLWQDGSRKKNYTVKRGGSYSVAATNKCGTAMRKIVVEEKICNITFPTAFTPNGDGRNDIFRVVNGYYLTHYKCIIYNRWGQKVFDSNDPAKGWDGFVNGRKAVNDVYIWFCEYSTISHPETVRIKGTVVLID